MSKKGTYPAWNGWGGGVGKEMGEFWWRDLLILDANMLYFPDPRPWRRQSSLTIAGIFLCRRLCQGGDVLRAY